MISNLIVIILIIFIGEFSALSGTNHGIGTPWEGFAVGIIAFGIVLGLLYAQRRFLRRDPPLMLVNTQILAFLLFFFFVAGGQRLIRGIPWAGSYDTTIITISLALYFIGLKIATPGQSLRLMMPLFAPPLALILISEVTAGIEFPLINALIFIAAIGAILAFSSPFLVRMWGCTPLQDLELKEHLERFCQRAHFSNGGILLWKALEGSPTAAIVGILPRFRYILLTRQLIRSLSVEEIEAVLAHEIGHNYRKHLLLYPFIFLGLSISVMLATQLLAPGLYEWGQTGEEGSYDSFLMVLLPLYIVISVLYFRYVFGFFSRLFERQADLHGFELGLSSENLIGALDKVAIATGYTHLAPSWHHFSIQERIDFLKAAAADPRVIAKHHRKARISLIIYFILLAGASWIVVASLYPNLYYFRTTAEWVEEFSRMISSWING
jgi:Zn-dependent protease with chaperone function